MTTIKVLYFASLKERIGHGSETIAIPFDQSWTVAMLREHLVSLGQGRDCLATQKNLKSSVNHELASFDSLILPGSEVAFFPPVTGG